MSGYDDYRFETDPTFNAWATQVEIMLTRGVMTVEEILAATRVGITNYAIRHATPVTIKVEYHGDGTGVLRGAMRKAKERGA